MVPSAAMLGFQIEFPIFTASGSLSGSLQPEPTRFVRYRFARRPTAFSPDLGFSFGRSETKTRYEPSGAIPGDESDHSPEKGATSGSDHLPSLLWDSRMTPHPVVLRVKYSVFPSGEKVGDPSFAGPEITPGEKISGAGPMNVAPAPPEAAG